MPLFEIGNDQLVPFRRIQAGADLYEKEIEDLLWANLDSFIGRSLFPVARQAQLGGGLIADVVALDSEGHVHVIEVKRDIDRRQLAQCLEYAGWARQTSLDEVARMFHGGTDEFFVSWSEFTETSGPRLIRQPPQLVLVARDFDERTDSALAFLTENNLPVTVLKVSMFEDDAHRRFVEIDADYDLEIVAVSEPGTPSGRNKPTRYEINGQPVQISDLLDAGLLTPEQELIWARPRIGTTYTAIVTAEGALRLQSGAAYSSPSRAAREAAGVPAVDGWEAWRTEDGLSLVALRKRLLESLGDEAE